MGVSAGGWLSAGERIGVCAGGEELMCGWAVASSQASGRPNASGKLQVGGRVAVPMPLSLFFLTVGDAHTGAGAPMALQKRKSVGTTARTGNAYAIFR